MEGWQKRKGVASLRREDRSPSDWVIGILRNPRSDRFGIGDRIEWNTHKILRMNEAHVGAVLEAEVATKNETTDDVNNTVR
ncbi:MAG: hypothetical protein HUU55_24140 [Myxococcales bacterium]|nr:hypothetical protein [Myxococcales bacterium]